MLGTFEIILIAVVIFLLFGATALPKIARSLGKAKSEFEKGLKEGEHETAPEEQNQSDPPNPKA